MTHRVWLVALTCGLSAGLFSGCSLLHWHNDESLVDKEIKPPPDLPDVDPPTSDENKPESLVRSENPGRVQQAHYTTDGANPVNSFPDDPTQYSNRRSQLLDPQFPRAADASGTQADAHVLKALRALLDKRLPDAVGENQPPGSAVQEIARHPPLHCSPNWQRSRFS